MWISVASGDELYDAVAPEPDPAEPGQDEDDLSQWLPSAGSPKTRAKRSTGETHLAPGRLKAASLSDFFGRERRNVSQHRVRHGKKKKGKNSEKKMKRDKRKRRTKSSKTRRGESYELIILFHQSVICMQLNNNASDCTM